MKYTNIQSFSIYLPYLLPVIGVAFFNWSTYAIILFFALENIILGIFYLLRGIVSVYYGGSVGFVIVFLIIFFAHSSVVLGLVYFAHAILINSNTISIPVLVANLVLICVTHTYILIEFTQFTKKIAHISNNKKLSEEDIQSKIEKEDFVPAINFLLNSKEMIYRIISVYAAAQLFIIIFGFIDYLPPLIISIALIIVFNFIRYIADSMLSKERMKMIRAYERSKKAS